MVRNNKTNTISYLQHDHTIAIQLNKFLQQTTITASNIPNNT